MEFFIKKNSTLPKLQVEVLNESRNGYNQLDPLISASTITFSMQDVETGMYKIANSPATVKLNEDGSGYILSYQFSKKNTNKNGNYNGFFTITNERGVYSVPIESDLYITVAESFTDSSMCCRRTKKLNPIYLLSQYSEGSVESLYTVLSEYPVDTDVEVSFTNVIEMSDGNNIENDVLITISKGQRMSQRKIIVNRTYSLLTGESFYKDIKLDTVGGSKEFKYVVDPKSSLNISPTPSVTPSLTPTTTPSVTPTVTSTPTQSLTPSVTITPTASVTPTPSITPTSSVTPTSSITPTLSITPTNSVTPTSSITPTSSVTPTSSITPTSSVTPTPSPTITPSISNTPDVTSSPTPTASVTPTSSITPTASVTPTSSITPTQSVTSTISPSVTTTITPTTTPSLTPSLTTSVTPTVTVTNTPTSSITTTPTPTQTITPTSTQPTGSRILYWDFSNTVSYSGTSTVFDLENNSNGTIMNTPLSGSTGCGTFVDFNGTSQYIYTDTNLSSLFTGTSPNKSEVTSIFMWIYPQGNGVILSEVGDSNSLDGWHTSIIEMVSGTLKFGLWSGAGNSVVTSSISTPLNNWYYVGMTYDGSTLTAYVNGVSAGNITFNRQAPYNNGAGLYYLLAHEDFTNMGDGGFGDYRVGSLEIYTTSLNSTQITNNYTSSSVNYICPTPTPTLTPSITPSVTPTLSITPTNSVTPTVTSSITPTNTITPTITPTNSVTPTPTTSAVVITGNTFSESFVQTQAPTTAIETAWNTFRTSLTGTTYTSFTWSSTNGNSITVSDPTLVQVLADSLRTATITGVTINDVVWRVGTGCGTPKIGGVAVEFSNIASCSASSTYALRPMINNANWGGTDENTVGAPSQTITLTFF